LERTAIEQSTNTEEMTPRASSLPIFDFTLRTNTGPAFADNGSGSRA
jgi:hypothetical protein